MQIGFNFTNAIAQYFGQQTASWTSQFSHWLSSLPKGLAVIVVGFIIFISAILAEKVSAGGAFFGMILIVGGTFIAAGELVGIFP